MFFVVFPLLQPFSFLFSSLLFFMFPFLRMNFISLYRERWERWKKTAFSLLLKQKPRKTVGEREEAKGRERSSSSLSLLLAIFTKCPSVFLLSFLSLLGAVGSCVEIIFLSKGLLWPSCFLFHSSLSSSVFVVVRSSLFKKGLCVCAESSG